MPAAALESPASLVAGLSSHIVGAKARGVQKPLTSYTSPYLLWGSRPGHRGVWTALAIIFDWLHCRSHGDADYAIMKKTCCEQKLFNML